MAIDVNSGDVGEHAMTLRDSKAIEKLAKEEPSIFTRIKDVITGIVNDIKRAFEGIKGNTFEYKRMEELLDDWSGIQKLWDDAFVDMSRNTNRAEKAAVENVNKNDADKSNAMYMLRTDEYYEGIQPCTRKEALRLDMMDNRNLARYRKEIDGVFNGELGEGMEVLIGMPPKVLLNQGIPNKPMHITQNVVMKIAYPNEYKIGLKDMQGKHNLGMSVLKNLPYQLYDPIAVTENTNNHKDDDSVLVWTEWKTNDGDSILAIVRINKDNQIIVDNRLVSMFNVEKGYENNIIKDKQKIKYTKNNKDINQLLSVRRYMPQAEIDDVFIKHSLTQPNPDVNKKNNAYTQKKNITSTQNNTSTSNSLRDNRSNREILVNALESTTRNETEKRILEDYKQMAGTLDMLEELKREKQRAMRDAQTAEERGGYEEDIRNIDDKIAYHDAKITGA